MVYFATVWPPAWKTGWCSKCSKMAGTLLVLERSVILYEQLSIRFLTRYQIIKIAKSDFVNSLSFLRNLVLILILNISVICWFFLTQTVACTCVIFLFMYTESGWFFVDVFWKLVSLLSSRMDFQSWHFRVQGFLPTVQPFKIYLLRFFLAC